MAVGEGSGGAKLMAVYVLRNGVLVEKRRMGVRAPENDFPTPMLSRMEPYASPIDGKEITSWGQRDRDLRDNNAYDPRDGSIKDAPRTGPKFDPAQYDFPFDD